MADHTRRIRLRGVRVHNLKGIDLDLPLNRLVVVTGVSGSGKSSLAFDTLYAEGQRRYIETFSPSVRQFLEKRDKPDADLIDGIPPAIAVAQRGGRRSSRSTVATVTEIDDYLGLLFAKLGRIICFRCDAPVAPASPATVARAIDAFSDRTRYQIAFPLDVRPESDLQALADALRADGFTRVSVAGQTTTLDALTLPSSGPMDVIVDRLVRGTEAPERRLDSIETAFAKGLGRCRVLTDANVSTFYNGWRCGRCGTDYLEPEPRLFRAHSPLGACPACGGLGRTIDIDPARTPPAYRTCSECRGARLRPEALAVKVGGLNIAQVSALKVRDARTFLLNVQSEAEQDPVVRRIVEQVEGRLGCLDRIGLDYLTLDRQARTLSGGEAQRVALTTALGSGLVNTLYVLDEPTIGLHPRDVGRLIALLHGLRDAGNSVVVVEHDPEVMRAADLLVDIGPGAGAAGGRVLYVGPPRAIGSAEHSATADFLSGRKPLAIPDRRRATDKGALRLTCARGHNLKTIDAAFPLGVLCVVTGVSGSGKSTLVEETLDPALRRRLGKAAAVAEPHGELIGADALDDVVLVDQSPIGRSGRSNPVTYLKAFDEVRKTFAATHDAKLRGYGPGQFSFNVAGGRCNACEGNGFLTIDMQFLPDVLMRCPECKGTRYRPETLEIAYRGRNIAEVLDLTAREAFGFFRNRPKVQARLRPLIDVGLDYLRLGQPATTLSGGEAQRLKLASHLSASPTAMTRSANRSRTLFLLDEPTTGLHPADTLRLLDALNSLLNLGHSLIVIEHNPEVMVAADWIIDLGPGAGDDGGRVVAAGTPEDVARSGTATGQVLAQALGIG